MCVRAQMGETLESWFPPNLGTSRAFQRVLEWMQGGTWEGILKCHCRLDSGSVKVSCPNSKLMPRQFVVSFTFFFLLLMMSPCPYWCPHDVLMSPVLSPWLFSLLHWCPHHVPMSLMPSPCSHWCPHDILMSLLISPDGPYIHIDVLMSLVLSPLMSPWCPYIHVDVPVFYWLSGEVGFTRILRSEICTW